MKHRNRRIIVSLVFGGTLALASSPVVATAQDIEQLIASMEEASQAAGAKNEEVKQYEEDIRLAAEEITGLEQAAKDATAVADEARAREVAFRTEVNRIAVAKYRGANTDVMSTVLNSDGPQVAIDRQAYLQALARNTEATLEGLAAQTTLANEERNKANQSLETATFRRAELEAQVAKLEKEQEELKKSMDDIVAKVETLSAEDRQRWVEKNGPIELTIAQVSGGSGSGLAALEAGLTKVGAPYGWGAAGPNTFDCSGLVVWSYAQQGKTLPRTSQAQMAGGTPVSRDQLQPGDVVGFYPGATHVGIYAGDGKILHASDYGIPVQVVSMDSMPFYGARRY